VKKMPVHGYANSFRVVGRIRPRSRRAQRAE
jgi:hypothetical protein